MKSQLAKLLISTVIICALATPAFAIGSGDASTNSGSPPPSMNDPDSALPPGKMPSPPVDLNGGDAERTAPDAENRIDSDDSDKESNSNDNDKGGASNNGNNDTGDNTSREVEEENSGSRTSK